MEFNRKKFNIMIAFTVCLICFVVVFSSIDFSAIEVDTEITPPIADSEQDNTETEEVEPPSSNIKDVPISTNPWTIFNCALNSLKKYDYKMTYISKINTQVPVIGNVVQTIDKDVYKIGNNHYIKTIANCTRSEGERFTEFCYENNSTVITNRNKSGNKSVSVGDYKGIYGSLQHELVYIINASTAKLSLLSSSMNPKSSCYELTLTFISPSAYTNYIKTMVANRGSGCNPSINSITATIQIDKKTGTFKSMKFVESYSIDTGVIGRASCNSTVNMTFNYGNYSSSSKVNEIKSELGVK